MKPPSAALLSWVSPLLFWKLISQMEPKSNYNFLFFFYSLETNVILSTVLTGIFLLHPVLFFRFGSEKLMHGVIFVWQFSRHGEWLGGDTTLPGRLIFFVFKKNLARCTGRTACSWNQVVWISWFWFGGFVVAEWYLLLYCVMTINHTTHAPTAKALATVDRAIIIYDVMYNVCVKTTPKLSCSAWKNLRGGAATTLHSSDESRSTGRCVFAANLL